MLADLRYPNIGFLDFSKPDHNEGCTCTNCRAEYFTKEYLENLEKTYGSTVDERKYHEKFEAKLKKGV